MPGDCYYQFNVSKVARTMRVLMAGQNYHVTGGSDRVLLDEVELLTAAGHEVIPFCAHSKRNLESAWGEYFPPSADLERPGLMDVAKFIYNPSAGRMIQSLIASHRPDIAHLHIYYGKLTGAILKPLEREGIPIVQTLHEYKVVCPTYLLTSQGQFCDACSGFKFYRAPFNRCNKGSFSRTLISTVESYASLLLGSVSKISMFIAVSEFLRTQVISMGVPAQKVVTIHNFIDTEQYVPNYEVGRYFIFFGRLEDNKGLWTLLSAFERLPHLQLVIIGDGSANIALRGFCSGHSILRKNVTFLGFKSKSELAPLVHGAICTIVPSIWNETFGLTVAESLAMGKPVIASRIGGIPEVVEEGVDALLVEPGDVEDLIDAIVTISCTPSRSREMGRRGRENMHSKFSKEKHLSRLLSVYKKVAR